MVDYKYSIYNSYPYQNKSKKSSLVNITRIIIYAAIISFTLYLLSNMSCINDVKEDYQDDKLDSLVVKVKNVFR